MAGGLGEQMTKRLPDPTWPGPQHMADAATRIAALLNGTLPEPIDPDRLKRAIARLSRDEVLTPGDLRMCCVGATTPVELGDRDLRIIDSNDLTSALLHRTAGAFDNDRL